MRRADVVRFDTPPPGLESGDLKYWEGLDVYDASTGTFPASLGSRGSS